MLYLAEVHKQKSGFIGAGKAEIKLLAFQRADQNWNPVPGEEVIPAEEANNLNGGTLVLADLNANRQVQRIQEAGRPLVNILQTFSRQVEKSRRQEAEIEQWKQSLTYQSQELNRRTMEMEARLEQLQQMENDFQHLEEQRQQIEVGQEAMELLGKEIERNRRELEGAWEHLRGEQRRLEEQQSEYQQATVLDEVQASQIRELLDRLSNRVAPAEAAQEQLNLAWEMVETQQGILNQHWHQMEPLWRSAEQQHEEVDSQSLALQNSFSEWQQTESALEQNKAELKLKTAALNSKQEYAQILGLQLRNQEELYQQIYCLIQPGDHIDISQKVNLEVLENMPLEQLQQVVQDLERDFQNASHFVNEQEEELRLQRQTIEELQAKLSQANDYDCIQMETELADERDSYQFLNETLIGQRQNLRERKEILRQHQALLWRRQGIALSNIQEDYKFELEPVLVLIQAQRQQQTQELQKLEQEISQLGFHIQQQQEIIKHQTHEQEMKRQELQSLEQNLLSLRTAGSESWGRINLYQEMLQPVQDSLDGLRQKLEAIAGTLAEVQQAGNYQLQTVDQIRSSLLSILPNPKLVAY